MSKFSSDTLSDTFQALADPTRRAILARLAKGESSIQDLAKPFKMSLPAISKHIKVLERSHLIVRRKRAQQRICSLETQSMKEAVSWIEHHRKLWEDRLDRLDEYLKQLQIENVEKKKGTKL